MSKKWRSSTTVEEERERYERPRGHIDGNSNRHCRRFGYNQSYRRDTTCKKTIKSFCVFIITDKVKGRRGVGIPREGVGVMKDDELSLRKLKSLSH
jgi:hypothetical protein